MYRTLWMSGVLALCTAAVGQDYTTSPPGYLNLEGDHQESLLGVYPAGRHMMFDAEQIGNAMTIKGTAYRHDNRVYVESQGMGRSWTNVTLSISDCNMSSLSNTFSKNPTSTPTQVFSNSVNWPTITGKPPAFPADWLLSFPFAQNWTYAGTSGICLDYVFTGGTLANSGTWNPSSAINYYKDAVHPSTYNQASSRSLGWSGNYVGCNDRGVTHVSGASVSTSAYFYSDTYSNASYAGRMKFSQTGQHFGNATQVVTLLGFRSLFDGIPFPGVYCNKIHVDISLPTRLFTQFSSTSGGLSELPITGPYGVELDESVAGFELVTQAGWADTQTSQLLLSSAASLIIPVKPRSFDHSTLYYYINTNPTGWGPYPNPGYNPVVRYTR